MMRRLRSLEHFGERLADDKDKEAKRNAMTALSRR